MQEALASAASQMNAFKNQLESSHKDWCEQVISDRQTEEGENMHMHARLWGLYCFVCFSTPLLWYSPCPKPVPRKPQVDPLQQELDETRQARDELSTRLDGLIEEMELQKGDLLKLREAADQVLAHLSERQD